VVEAHAIEDEEAPNLPAHLEEHIDYEEYAILVFGSDDHYEISTMLTRMMLSEITVNKIFYHPNFQSVLSR
jgi:hypothetical protein